MAQVTSGLKLTATSSSMPEPTLQTRHRRFFESRRRRETRRLMERGDDKDEDKVEGKVEDTESSESSADESSTKTKTETVASSPEAATISSTNSQSTTSLPPPSSSSSPKTETSTLASITTVPSSSAAVITSSAVATPPVPTAVPVVQESSSLITSIKTTSTQSTSSAPALSSSQSVNSSPVTVPQPSTTSRTSATSPSSVLPIPTPGTTIGPVNEVTPPPIFRKTSSSTISGGAVAGIVLGIAALIIAAVLAFCLVRRRGRPNPRDSSLPPMSVVGANPPSVIARAKRRAESILWGSDATVGTRTEASFPPATVPASMQPGGRHNKNGVNMLPPPPAYPDPIRNPNRNTATTDLEYFSRPISSRWPGATMQSISGMVPPFKNIKSWVDKGNGGGELEPKGPYSKMI